jgi:hypothetical protein
MQSVGQMPSLLPPLSAEERGTYVDCFFSCPFAVGSALNPVVCVYPTGTVICILLLLSNSNVYLPSLYRRAAWGQRLPYHIHTSTHQKSITSVVCSTANESEELKGGRIRTFENAHTYDVRPFGQKTRPWPSAL